LPPPYPDIKEAPFGDPEKNSLSQVPFLEALIDIGGRLLPALFMPALNFRHLNIWILTQTIAQKWTCPARTLLNQFPAPTHAIQARFPNQFDGGPSYAHSMFEENAWTIGQCITLAVSDHRSFSNAIDTMLTDRLPWCQPLLTVFSGFSTHIAYPKSCHRRS